LYIARRLWIERAIGYTGMSMTDARPARRYRFGAFEADAATGELRRQGLRVKLNAQPFQVLCMLLERPGELLTREESPASCGPTALLSTTNMA
jgi:DNA-binding response OmpR family regulator